MSAVLWTVETGTGGRVSITPRPKRVSLLSDEMAALRVAGVDVLVSALTAEDNELVGLAGEAQAADEAGLEFRALPIQDMSTPEESERFRTELDELASRVRKGEHVAVHCFASIGRSGMITALLLCRNGWEPEAAMARLSELRGATVPETAEQRRWVIEAARAGGI